jgi:hypothetical protein
VYTVLADSETFGTAPQLISKPSDAEKADPCCGIVEQAASEGSCCGGAATSEAVATGASNNSSPNCCPQH